MQSVSGIRPTDYILQMIYNRIPPSSRWKFENNLLIITYGIPTLKKIDGNPAMFNWEYRSLLTSFQATEFPTLNTHDRLFPPIINGFSTDKF